jgi:hypothetical protein
MCKALDSISSTTEGKKGRGEEDVILKFPAIIIELAISLFNSVHFSMMNFNGL